MTEGSGTEYKESLDPTDPRDRLVLTLPRFREDQLQRLAWQWLIPLSLLNIILTTAFKVAF